MPILSRLVAASVAALIWTGPVAARQQTLEIIRDANGSVIQSIPMESWSFDPVNGVLTVKSVTGNRLCNAAPAAKNAANMLNLDGRLYALDSIDRSKVLKGRLVVRPVRDGVFPVCLPRESTIANQIFGKGVGALQLNLDLINGDSSNRRDTSLIGDIDLIFTPVGYAMTGTQKLLCVDGAGASGVALNFTDINGELDSVQGLTGVSFDPNNNRFSANTGGTLACFQEAVVTENTLSGPPSVDSVCEEEPADPDLVFVDSFEQASGSTAIPGLFIDLVLNQNPSIDDDDALQYDLVVTNCSDSTVSNIQVRDFFPGSGGTAEPNLSQQNGAGEQSSWVCGAGITCNPSNGQSYINTQVSSIPGRGQAVISATRTLGTATAGQLILIDALVSETASGLGTPENDVSAWNVEVLQSGNLAPMLTTTGTVLANVDEDEVNAPVTGGSTFTIDVCDVDTALSNNFVFGSNDPGLISTSRINGVFNADVTPDSGCTASGTIDVTLTPEANQSGSAQISIAIEDADGRASTPLSVPVTVAAVNDPPSFRLAIGFNDLVPAATRTRIEVPAGHCALTRPNPGADYSLDIPGCADMTWAPNIPANQLDLVFSDWYIDVSGGPADEPQAVPTTGFQVISDPNGIFAITPSLTGDLLSYTLTGNSGTATVEFTATDSGGASTTIPFNVVISNSRPVINPAGPVSFPENSTGNVIMLSATDAENDPIQNWGIIGGNTNVDGDATPPFSINPSTGLITAVDPGDLNFEGAVSQFNLIVQVSDGNAFSDPTTVTINLSNVNDAPFLVSPAQQLNVNSGGSVVVTGSNLNADDEDNPDNEIRYEVVNAPDNGEIRVNTTALGVGDFFTEADITAGIVSYVHTGGGTFDGVTLQLENPDGTTNGSTFTLFVQIN